MPTVFKSTGQLSSRKLPTSVSSVSDQLNEHERHGIGLLGVSIGFLVIALVFAKTQFELSDLTWLISLTCQLLFGYQVVRFFGIASDSPELRILAAAVLAIFIYSFSYQLLLLVFSPNLSWVVCHIAMLVVIVVFERRRLGPRGSPLIIKQYASGFGHQTLMQLGGAICILSTSAQWTLLIPLGIGTVIAAWLLHSNSGKSSARLAVLTLLITGAASSGWSWYVGRLARGYWWVTSNDFQTAVSHSVLISRFGMRDHNLIAGLPIKHHWSITGWAGMTNPWSHPETEIGVLTTLLLGFGLFLAINAWVSRIIGPDYSSRAWQLGVVSAAVGSTMLSFGWASQQTIFGLMAFASFGLLFADAVKLGLPRMWVPIVLLGAASVWSNALTLPFLAVIVPVTLVASCFNDGRPTRGQPRYSQLFLVALSVSLFGLGVVFWRFLFLPSARSGSFYLSLFQSRDHLIPQLARLLPGPHLEEVRSVLIFVLTDHLAIAILFSFLLVVSESRTSLTRSVALLVGGLACVTARFALTGLELVKFNSWGSFMFTIALTTTLVIWLARQGVSRQSWASNFLVIVIGAAALTVPFLKDVFLRNSGLGQHRLALFVGGLSLLLIIVSVARMVIGRCPRHSSVRLLIVWIAGILIGNFSISISDHVIDFHEIHLANPSSSLDLLASLEVREVSEWLKRNTDQDSIVASNYFCHVGKMCPSDTSEPIRPSMWGVYNADMSNLAAYSERRFWVQAFRHVYGNDQMPDLARTRVRQSLDAATSGDLSSLQQAGISYFVLDRDSAPASRARMSSTVVYENSRFSVYRID